MMDIQEQIDQFLQIPEIKEIFSDHDIHWHVGEYSQGWYFDFSVPDYEKGFFLGAWNAWQAVKAQAVPEGFVLVPTKSVKYFSNDGENYEIHNTLAEAKHEAECAIEHFSDRLADQECDPRCDGNFHDVGYGVVLAQSAYSLDHVVIQEDIDNGDYSYEVGTEIMSLFLVEAQEQSHD